MTNTERNTPTHYIPSTLIWGVAYGSVVCIESSQPHRVVLIFEEYANDTTANQTIALTKSFTQSRLTNTAHLRVRVVGTTVEVLSADSLKKFSGVVDIWEEAE